MTFDSGLALAIAGLTVCGVVMRPRGWPEAIWAVLGAAAVVLLGLLPFGGALAAAARGLDVYLFLTGMMLLSETARRERLFDWLAVEAVLRARGSPRRLFLLVYGVGTLVTVFMSNDATAVVLTPAVFAAASKAKLEPLPYVYVCAFIANAASFVLPISNPANLVVFDGMMPALADWLARFALPSLVSIAVTYAMLRWRLRDWIEPSFAEAPSERRCRAGQGSRSPASSSRRSRCYRARLRISISGCRRLRRAAQPRLPRLPPSAIRLGRCCATCRGA